MATIPNPAHDLLVAQAADPGDPAFDLDRPGSDEAVQRYIRTRSLDDLASIPRRDGAGLTLFRLRAITKDERRRATGLVGAESQAYFAFRLACTGRVEEAVLEGGTVRGREVPAKVEKVGELRMSSEAWVEDCVSIGGGQLVDELGAFVLARANVHPRALDPFELPYGLSPAR